MRWKYKGKIYTSIPYDWEEFKYSNIPENTPIRNYCNLTVPLVYIPKWNRCYWLEGLRYGGNGNKLKAYIVDPYTWEYHYIEARNMEIVISTQNNEI